MRDEYVADIGDFAKYGLLLRLSGMTFGGKALRLGVHWYRFDGFDPATSDGQRINYLDGQTEEDLELISCDEGLAEKLRNILNTDRSIQSVEQSGVLPADTCFYGEGLNFDDRLPYALRVERRSDWNSRAFTGLDNCDSVFFDPDNGLKVKSHSRTSRFGPKYVFCDELIPYWERGQSLIIYQHFDRDKERIQNKSARLRQALGIDGPSGEIIALSAFSRIFFVIPNPAKAEVAQLLRERVVSFMDSCWGDHFTRVDC